MARKPIKIKKSKQGSLRRAAKKAGAMKDGKISSTWLNKKVKSSNPTMKRKAVFAKNARKWKKK